MSTTLILALIGSALFVLIAVALAMQTMEKSSKEKRRLETALKNRARNFDYLLDSLPPGMLSPELHQLLCKSHLEVNEQLCQADSKNSAYSDALQRSYQRLEQAKKNPQPQRQIIFQERNQVKEAQQLLNTLFTFIVNQQNSNRLGPAEAQQYMLQVRRLMVQVTTDGMLTAAQQAQTAGKIKLAIHYHNMAIDRCKKENKDGFYNDKIQQLQQRAAQLELSVGQNDSMDGEMADEAAKEWDELITEDETWKKKAIYD